MAHLRRDVIVPDRYRVCVTDRANPRFGGRPRPDPAEQVEFVGLAFDVVARGPDDGLAPGRFGTAGVPLPLRDLAPHLLRRRHLHARRAGRGFAVLAHDVPPGPPGFAAGHLLLQNGCGQRLPHPVGTADAQPLTLMCQPGDHIVMRDELVGVVLAAQHPGHLVEQPPCAGPPRPADHRLAPPRHGQCAGPVGGVNGPPDRPVRCVFERRITATATMQTQRRTNVQRPLRNPLAGQMRGARRDLAGPYDRHEMSRG